MENVYYYVYIPDLIGIKTNVKGFRWGFGKCEESVSEDEFKKCRIKVNLEKRPDKDVFNDIDLESYNRCYRYFRACETPGSLLFDQKIKFLKFRYTLSVSDNNINIVVGNTYFKYLKAKLMYVHPIWYITFDLVSFLLLKNGMSTLYCSAVRLPDDRVIVFLAPPNTGKSLTVLKLQKDFNADIIAEDMAVTDGVRIWGAPYTNLYRDYSDKSLFESEKLKYENRSNNITSVVFLQKGSKNIQYEVSDYQERLTLLNHYSLGYYYSPCVKALNYFNDELSVQNAQEKEKELLTSLSKNAKGYIIEDLNPMHFSDKLMTMLGTNAKTGELD